MKPLWPLAFCALSVVASPIAAEAPFGETANFQTLKKYLQRGDSTSQFRTGFDRQDRCLYTVRLRQDLDARAWRDSLTPVDFTALSTQEYTQQYFSNGVSQITLKLRDDTPDLKTALKLHDPEKKHRKAYLEAYEGSCENEVCTMTAPSREMSFVVLGPEAKAGGDFVLLALTGLVEHCAHPAEEESK